MNSSSISIAMATFNGARFLREQLESLARQKYPVSELVVCDDRSADATIEILQSFKEEACFPVELIQNDQHLGYKENFMKVASLCRGGIIAFCDQDDIWNDDKLAVVSNAFADQQCLVLSHDFSIFHEERNQPDIESYFRLLDHSGYPRALSIKGCSMAFRRELMERVGWPAPHSQWAHDTWIAVTSSIVKRRSYVALPLIKHRIHKDNASGWVLRRRGSRLWLGTLDVPRFTCPDEIDRLVDMCVPMEGIEELIRAMSGPNSYLSKHELDDLKQRLEKKVKIAGFRRSDDYDRLLPRIRGALNLLLSRCYTVGNGISGFLSDVLGRRGTRRSSSAALLLTAAVALGTYI